MNSDQPYRPIDCSLHDRLESAATLRKRVCIAYRSSDNELLQVEDRIVDIYTRDGVEFMGLGNGTEIRLDDIDSVDGLAFSAGT
jgi:transcriptional antiterminator Rof (Rho-off)